MESECSIPPHTSSLRLIIWHTYWLSHSSSSRDMRQSGGGLTKTGSSSLDISELRAKSSSIRLFYLNTEESGSGWGVLCELMQQPLMVPAAFHCLHLQACLVKPCVIYCQPEVIHKVRTTVISQRKHTCCSLMNQWSLENLNVAGTLQAGVSSFGGQSICPGKQSTQMWIIIF